MNSIGGGLEMRKEALGTYISVLAKVGKDPTLCSSFWPISLINEDIKIYPRILTPFMSNWIEKDQVGFIPGKEARDNEKRTLLLMHVAKKVKNPVFS